MDKLEILYRDECLVAINKPAGLLTHKSAIASQEIHDAMKMTRDQIGQWVYPVHRLDKPTSGVLLFALDSETAKKLTQQFTEGSIQKSYIAVVRGYTEEHALIDYPLKKLWDKRTDPLSAKDQPAQPARTTYQRLATVELPYPVGRYETARYSLLNVQPLTGRGRQIRRHLKHIFHPIIGDKKHGDHRHNKFFLEQWECGRMLLHAYQLRFLHPHTRESMQICAPLRSTFSRILSLLTWGEISLSD